MRIIRLSTNTPDGIFDNNFQSDIIVKPNSKIALANIAFEVQDDEIIIESGNDVIQYLISGTEPGDLKTITLSHATYNKSNISTLIDEITKKFNQVLSTNGKEIGMEWRVLINKSGRVEFTYRIGKLQDYPTNFTLENITRTSSGVYNTDTGGPVSTLANRMYLNKYLSRGCGVWRCKIHKLTASANPDNQCGFTFGVTRFNPDTLTGREITLANTFMSIRAIKPATVYNFSSNGSGLSASTVTPNIVGAGNSQNDTLQIAIEGSNLVARVFQDGGAADGELLVSIAYNQETLYPFCNFFGDTNQTRIHKVRLTESQFQPSPYKLYNDTSIDHDLLDLETLGAVPTPPFGGGINSNNLLRFEGDSLANFLEFDNVRNPPGTAYKTAGYDCAFVADNTITLPTSNELFIIELLNVKLNSYDGLSEERRNIIATIPKRNENTLVQYEPNEKVFVDINNADAMSLRNLQAVIRANDLTFQPTKGLSSMTLLIKDPEE